MAECVTLCVPAALREQLAGRTEKERKSRSAVVIEAL
jgi:hypothetical protein